MEDFQQDIAYYPFLVAEQGEVDSEEVRRSSLKIFWSLPYKEQDILTSREMPGILFQMQKDYHLTRDGIMQLSRLIRWYFYKKLTWEELGVRVESLLLANQRPASEAKGLMDRIHKEIIELVPAPVIEEEDDTVVSNEINSEPVSMPILKALAQYPQIHSQRITKEKIRIKGDRDPVAPTVRNWLRAYRDVLGVGKHGTLERGKFLFQNENTKHLSPQERDFVAMILKSLDEGDSIMIHPVKQEVLFGGAPVAPPVRPVATPPDPVIREEAPRSGLALSPEAFAIASRPGSVPLSSSRPPAQPTPTQVARAEHEAAAAEQLFQRFSIEGGEGAPTIPRDSGHEAIQRDSVQFSTGHVLPGEQAMMGGQDQGTHPIDPQELIQQMLQQKRFAQHQTQNKNSDGF